MNTPEKTVKNKLGLLNLAKTLGNVSQACKVRASGATPATATKHCMKPAVKAIAQPAYGQRRER